MDASGLEEASAMENATRNKSPTSLHSLADSKRQQSGSEATSDLSKHTDRPGAKNVNGTRFTIERVQEHVLLSSSQQPEDNLTPKQPEGVTATEPDKESDLQNVSSVVSDVIPSTDDVLSRVISSPHSVAKPKQSSSDVLSNKMVKVVDEVSVAEEDCELQRDGNHIVNDKSSAKERQGEEENEENVTPVEKAEVTAQKEYQEHLSDQTKYQDQLAKEIQKLEEDNEKVLERHREILAKRLEESISQLEIEQVLIYTQNPSGSECHTPSSESIRSCVYLFMVLCKIKLILLK